MDTDQVQYCANRMLAQADELQHQVMQLLIAMRSVDWYGPNRDYFVSEVEKVAQQMLGAGEEAKLLASMALRSAENWQEIDVFFVNEFSRITPDRPIEKVLS